MNSLSQQYPYLNQDDELFILMEKWYQTATADNDSNYLEKCEAFYEYAYAIKDYQDNIKDIENLNDEIETLQRERARLQNQSASLLEQIEIERSNVEDIMQN